MSLYAIGDLHLHFQSEVRSRSGGRNWRWIDHEEKLRKNCQALLTEEDTLVLVGDHSWGRKLAECEEDLDFIQRLPGRKIVIRGNHDMFWDVKKTGRLNERYRPGLSFLQDSFEHYEDYAIVGTKGYSFEGPFYIDGADRIVGWDEQEKEHAEKLVKRELARLRTSFELARKAGYRKYIMFLHYPPTSMIEETSGFTDMAEEYGADQVIYAHCHGEKYFGRSIHGEMNGISYHLVSGDYLLWVPRLIIE